MIQDDHYMPTATRWARRSDFRYWGEQATFRKLRKTSVLTHSGHV